MSFRSFEKSRVTISEEELVTDDEISGSLQASSGMVLLVGCSTFIMIPASVASSAFSLHLQINRLIYKGNKLVKIFRV